MKKTTAITSALILTASQAFSAPFMAIGSNAELFLTGTVGIDFNDNITLGNDVIATGQTVPFNPVRDDVVWRLSPGAALEFGQNALISGTLAAKVGFERYSDNGDLDSELADLSFTGSHQDASSKTSLKASYRELNQNTVDSRSPTLSRRDVVNFGAEHEMELSAKTSVLFGVDYTDTDYARASFTDRIRTEIPFRIYYDMTEKVDLSLSFRYRTIETDVSTQDSEDLFVGVGARGQFTPKLSGFFRVGATDRSRTGLNSTALGLFSNFSYVYSEKTSLTFGVGNDFGTSGAGDAQENMDVFVGFQSALTPEFTLTSRIAFRQIDYVTRDDEDYIEGSIGGEYTMSENLKLIGRVSHKDNSSSAAVAEFDNTIFSFSAQLRY